MTAERLMVSFSAATPEKTVENCLTGDNAIIINSTPREAQIVPLTTGIDLEHLASKISRRNRGLAVVSRHGQQVASRGDKPRFVLQLACGKQNFSNN